MKPLAIIASGYNFFGGERFLDMKPFLEHLVALHKRRKLRQVDVEKQAGLPKTSMSKIETGERQMTREELFKVAAVLEVSVQVLLGLSEEDIEPMLVDIPTPYLQQFAQYLRRQATFIDSLAP